MSHAAISGCERLRNLNKEMGGKVVGDSGQRLMEIRRLGVITYIRGVDNNMRYIYEWFQEALWKVQNQEVRLISKGVEVGEDMSVSR